MEKAEVQILIEYWEMILSIQSEYLNPNITEKIFHTLEALEAYRDSL